LSEPFNEQDTALLTLGKELRARGYRFTTPTPATHALVNAREKNRLAKSLTDVFGWSRPFEQSALPAEITDQCSKAGILRRTRLGRRSDVRFSTLGDLLFVHSSFPTKGADAVFFGPDTYRFARFLKSIASEPISKSVRIIDIGCGSGVGGIYLSQLLQHRCNVDLVLGDINPQALRFSRINAALNECYAEVVESDVLNHIEGEADIIIANPPYLVDGAQRLYRHGGGEFGGALSARIVEESLPRLRRRGRLVLYTGSAVVDGVDTFWRQVEPLVARSDLHHAYEEIDPDVFAEELSDGPYQRADRIAVVALTVRREEK
jgi:methylase of polypeptide subunit release factors